MIFAFSLGVRGMEGRSTLNSISLGKAKAQFLRDIQDWWPATRFIDVVGHMAGPVHTSAAFLRTATYRGMPDLRCGHEVVVSGNHGYVVGHNYSAIFDVLFTQGPWQGCVLNCHPHDFARLTATAEHA